MKKIFIGTIEVEVEEPIIAKDYEQAKCILEENQDEIIREARWRVPEKFKIRVRELIGDKLPGDFKNAYPYRSNDDMSSERTCQEIFEDIQYEKAEAERAAKVKQELEEKQFNFDSLLGVSNQDEETPGEK